MLGAFWSAPSRRHVADAIEQIADEFESLVLRISTAAPGALLILNTVYDPTDGTGRLSETSEVLPIEYLPLFNDRVRDLALATPSAVLADVHRHFLGHGITAAADERWYWAESIIEPGIIGASEIRRLWIDALANSAAAR
jgi:hypothetical protein